MTYQRHTSDIEALRRADPVRTERVDSLARRIGVLWLRGAYPQAERLAACAEEEIEQTRERLADAPLATLGVSVRLCNALERLDVTTLRELSQVSPSELAQVSHIGPQAIDALWRVVVQAAVGRE